MMTIIIAFPGKIYSRDPVLYLDENILGTKQHRNNLLKSVHIQPNLKILLHEISKGTS